MKFRFWYSASAVPRYQSWSLRPRYGCQTWMPFGQRRFRSHGSPIPMWWINECGRYCVSTATLYRPELTTFDSAKSMIRYFPANGTAGLARFSPRTLSRLPSPPARISVSTSIAASLPAEPRRAAARAQPRDKNCTSLSATTRKGRPTAQAPTRARTRRRRGRPASRVTAGAHPREDPAALKASARPTANRRPPVRGAGLARRISLACAAQALTRARTSVRRVAPVDRLVAGAHPREDPPERAGGRERAGERQDRLVAGAHPR